MEAETIVKEHATVLASGEQEKINLGENEQVSHGTFSAVNIKNHLKKSLSKFRGLFMLYFLVTIVGWGTQDFLLSYLASRKATLASGDTLAFLSIGNCCGTVIANIILWQWKKWALKSFIGATNEVVKIPDTDASKVATGRAEKARAAFVANSSSAANSSVELLSNDSTVGVSSNEFPTSKNDSFLNLPGAVNSDFEEHEVMELSEDVVNPGASMRRRNVSSSELEAGTRPASISRFDSIRKLLRKPLFLQDAFKLTFISGVIGSVAPLGYYELSVRGGEASTVAPLISLYVIVPAVLGLVFLKEKKSIIKFLGIGAAIAAVVLFALSGGGGFSLTNFANIMFFCLGFFGWGIAYFIRSLAASKGTDFSHMMVMAAAGLMFGNYLLITFWFGVGNFVPDLGHGLTILAGCSSVLGDLGFFLLSKEGKEASKIVPLTGTYILFPAILGFVFLNDSVNVMKIVAIVLSLLALGLLGAS